jgi:hypothetical protein
MALLNIAQKKSEFCGRPGISSATELRPPSEERFFFTVLG